MSVDPAAVGAGQLVELVRARYGLGAHDVVLLPGREHAEAAGYRVECDEGAYFLKLSPAQRPRLELSRLLADAGIVEVLAPLRSRDAALCVRAGPVWAMLYPFVEGENAFRRPLSPQQWTVLGAAVRAVHGTALPPSVASTLRVEHYTDRWRTMAREYVRADSEDGATDDAARGLRTLLAGQRARILALVDHAERLASRLRARDLPPVPCHGDLHAGNVLVAASGAVFIVDWDDPVLAPKERDLMFAGAGIGHAWNERWEEAAFYAGYGAAPVDAEAIAYYRCDRIVEDVALYCDRLLGDSSGTPAQRAMILEKLDRAFDPDDVVEIAERTVAAL